jgi:hypothetical protein
MATEMKILDKQSVEIPMSLKSLPMFQMLGDRLTNVLPDQAKTPEGQKKIGMFLFWGLFLFGSYWFFTHINTLLETATKVTEFASQSILFIIYAIIAVCLAIASPGIVRLFNRWFKIFEFKQHKNIIDANPIESLQLLKTESDNTLKRAGQKISDVLAVRLDFANSSQTSKDVYTQKASDAKKFTAGAADLEKKAGELRKTDSEGANELMRKAGEIRNNAILALSVAQAEEVNSKSFAQYANQIGKVVEKLRDNESFLRMTSASIGTTITILAKKLEASKKIKSATDELADAFNIKDGWIFQQAIGAATFQFSQNIASAKSNLDFLDANNPAAALSAPNQADVEAMMAKLDQNNFATFNVGEVSSAYHELSKDEKVDQGFSILN